MTWADGPDASTTELAAEAEAEPVDGLAAYPPVVAVVVTRNPGPWFEDTLAGLAAQDYPDLTVLVVDGGSTDDPTARIAAQLPGAFVRLLGEDAGFAAAANEALRTVEGATFLLLCHDDVVPEPPAVRILVEEAYRSNAGIVGPKLVSADDPGILLEVGRAIDRFGVAYTGIEPGEFDQEQHDGVRDVFYVTTASMLVRADLLAELGGFDEATGPGSEDLDLCWRARLAGARVLVAPDARVTHRETADARHRADRSDEPALAQRRVRVLLTSYSLVTLLWLAPVGVVVACVEAVGDLVTGRPRRARAAISGWFSNLLHLRSLRASRRRAQRLRRVSDGDLRELQIGTTTRLGDFLAHHLHTDDRLRQIGDRSRSALGSVSDRMRGPAAVVFLGFVALVLIGSRDFITGRVPGIGTLVPWVSGGDLLDAFGSAWRSTGLGSPAAAPPLLALTGLFGSGLLGAVGLARTLVVVGAIPLGAVGAYRFARPLVGLRGPALVAGVIYGVNPVARNAIASGRFGPLVLFAVFPFVLGRVVRLAGLDADRGASDPAPAVKSRGGLLRLAVLVAVAAACYPVAPAIFVVAAGSFVLAAPLARGWAGSWRALGIAVVAALAAAVLLFPWPLAYATSHLDGASLGFAFRPDLGLVELLRFQSGPSGASWVMWGLLVGASVPLFLAVGARLAWATRGWVLAVVGWAMVWVPEQAAPHRFALAPEAGLTLAAFGLSIALGVGASVFVDGIHRFRFGWRQPAAIIGGVALALPMLGFVADSIDGRWHAPSAGWVDTLSFTNTLAAKGQFRILWIGRAEVLPLDPVVLPDGTGYTLTRNGSGAASELLRAPQGDADHVVDRAIELARDGLTDRLGRLLAPMGVRWVALPSTQGPGGGGSLPLRGWHGVLDGQLDLARLRSAPGLVLYENLAWIPLHSVAGGREAALVPIGARDPIRAALGVDLSTAVPVVGDTASPPGIVLSGEAYDSEWDAIDGSGRQLGHVQAFGWENGYRLSRKSSVSFEFGAQWQRWAFLGVSLVIWLFVGWRWRRTRIRLPESARSGARAMRERRARRDPLWDAADDDAYWWERV
jgi:GT2 family glycosyltransferase